MMRHALPGESTEDPEEFVGNDEAQEGSRRDQRATTCSLGRRPDRLRSRQTSRLRFARDVGVEGESDALICEPGRNPLDLAHESAGVHQIKELGTGQQTSLDVGDEDLFARVV